MIPSTPRLARRAPSPPCCLPRSFIFLTRSLFILPLPVPIPAPVFAVGYVLLTWYFARQNRGRINHDAHLGGAMIGLAFVLLTDPGAFSGFTRAVFG